MKTLGYEKMLKTMLLLIIIKERIVGPSCTSGLLITCFSELGLENLKIMFLGAEIKLNFNRNC